MRGQRGFTFFEMVVVVAIVGTLVAVAVPAGREARGVLGADAAARELTLVLRDAQSRAQARGVTVNVTVASNGSYTVHDARSVPSDGISLVSAGELGAPVTTNYPGGAVEFGKRGWPCSRGSTTPRAGTFTIGAHRVVLQLGGFVRCQ